jgi:hypothetical protein
MSGGVIDCTSLQDTLDELEIPVKLDPPEESLEGSGMTAASRMAVMFRALMLNR